jgi:mono/diheme cytochrome c family protein
VRCVGERPGPYVSLSCVAGTARLARALSAGWLVLCFAALAIGCDQSMYTQPKFTPYAPDPRAPQGTSARLLVLGVQSRGSVPAKQIPESIPVPVTMALLKRGQERYGIFCAPCHGPVGNGEGILPEYGFPHPPSYFNHELLAAPDRHFYEVITNGKDKMYSYADRVPPPDRWAIIAYIRALQRSQHASLAEVPPGVRISEDGR